MKTLSLTSRTFITFHGDGFYFRIANKGLSLDMNLPVLFSERHHFRKVWRIGRLAIEIL